MAQGRMIQADLFQSADLSDLGAVERLLWIGLIVNADNAGMGRADARFLRNKVLPGLRIGPARVERALDSFAARGMLRLSEQSTGVEHTSDIFERVKCYELTNFAAYQRLRRRKGKYNAPQIAPEVEEEDEDEVEDEDEGRAQVRVEAATAKPVAVVADDAGEVDRSAARRLEEDFGLGAKKAQALARVRSAQDLDAWTAWRAREGATQALLVHLVQRFRNPAEMERVEGPRKRTPSRPAFSRRSSFSRPGKFDDLESRN